MDPPSPEWMDLAFAINPFMGHFTCSYATTALRRDLLMATRYEFNVYSYDSDLSFGIIYSPPEKQQTLKFRVGLSQVLVCDECGCTNVTV